MGDKPKKLTQEEVIDWIVDMGTVFDAQAVPVEAIPQEALDYMLEVLKPKPVPGDIDPEAMMPGECDICHGDDRFVYLFHGIMQCGRCALKIYTALSEAELAALRQMATAATESLNDE